MIRQGLPDTPGAADDFALRGLDPWPPKGGARSSEDYARKVVDHLRLCGWEDG